MLAVKAGGVVCRAKSPANGPVKYARTRARAYNVGPFVIPTWAWRPRDKISIYKCPTAAVSKTEGLDRPFLRIRRCTAGYQGRWSITREHATT